jgi:hypothetical protein
VGHGVGLAAADKIVHNVLLSGGAECLVAGLCRDAGGICAKDWESVCVYRILTERKSEQRTIRRKKPIPPGLSHTSSKNRRPPTEQNRVRFPLLPRVNIMKRRALYPLYWRFSCSPCLVLSFTVKLTVQSLLLILSYIQKFSSYLTENTIRHLREFQPVCVVSGNNCSLLW